jgi:peptidoglycan/xylan/chitin deacetylase (PgdA/CDA1 family)
LQRLIAEQRVPLICLFYHRIADQWPNPWTMPRATFERQVRWLGKTFEFISLSELQHRIANRCNPRPAVAITFDDGYADNLTFALPWLIRLQIPVTYFVSLAPVSTGMPFAHDVRAGRPLRPNSVEELRWLALRGIEIGAHTRTHPDFSSATSGDLVTDEVVAASAELSQHMGRPIEWFSVPIGLPAQIQPGVVDAIRVAGFRGFCSAYGDYNQPDVDGGFHIRRIHGDCSWWRMRNWWSFDPTKRSQVPRSEATGDHVGAGPSTNSSPVECTRTATCREPTAIGPASWDRSATLGEPPCCNS